MKPTELKEGQVYILSPDMYQHMTANEQLMLKSMIYVYKSQGDGKFLFHMFMDEEAFQQILKNVFKDDAPRVDVPDTFYTSETLCEDEVELLIEKNFNVN